MTSQIDLLATCWISAGDVKPLDESEVSPVPIAERIAAVADTGWAGIGLAQDDLRALRDEIGFVALKELIDDAGLRYVEVELLTDWWETGDRRAASDEVRALLFAAAVELDAVHIKIGTAFGEALDSIDPLVEPLRALADDAATRGIRLALEAMPFSMVSSVPMAADLIRAVDRPNCGVLVDSWHVFRAGTTLDELARALDGDILFGVEINDADETPIDPLFHDTRDRRRFCGEGSFDLTGMIRVIDATGFRGPWGVEVISEELRALPVREAVERAADTARTSLAAALG